MVIVGITKDFAASSMSCIVEDTDSHIIQVDNWNGLEDFIDEVGRLTCESSQNWVLTEVKAGSDDNRFLEFTNIGVDYNPYLSLDVSNSNQKPQPLPTFRITDISLDRPSL